LSRTGSERSEGRNDMLVHRVGANLGPVIEKDRERNASKLVARCRESTHRRDGEIGSQHLDLDSSASLPGLLRVDVVRHVVLASELLAQAGEERLEIPPGVEEAAARLLDESFERQPGGRAHPRRTP